jgi:hypothetical protein
MEISMTGLSSIQMQEIVRQQGTTLYRLAVLLTNQISEADQLMRRMTQRAIKEPQETSFHSLLALLLQEAERQHKRHSKKLFRLSLQAQPSEGELYAGPNRTSPFTDLPFGQRRILALVSQLGYDDAHTGQALGLAQEQAASERVAALEGLAAAAELKLPHAVSNDFCFGVRKQMQLHNDRELLEPHLRSHLALCRECQAYLRVWNELSERLDQNLRSTMRQLSIPAALQSELLGTIEHASQKRPWWQTFLSGRPARLSALAAVVVALIAALVLPGFFDGPTTTTATQSRLSEQDLRAMLERAYDLHFQAPRGSGVWHARWEARWYFPNGKYAPMHLDAWYDGSEPSRYRFQAVHASGGALYELQVSDGMRELWYALGPSYFDSLYGNLGITPETEQLVRRRLSPEQLQEAGRLRLESGAWNIGPSYLKEALRASELQTLGRQPLGNRTVQIVSFVSQSSLGFPKDHPLYSPRITVLLGIDVEDGRLRLVTELDGTAQIEQASLRTWQMINEEWVYDRREIDRIFMAQRAWNGFESFPEVATGTVEDLQYPLDISIRLAPPEALQAVGVRLPAQAFEEEQGRTIQRLPSNGSPLPFLIRYNGQTKNLAMTWRAIRPEGQYELYNGKLIQITPARNQHYQAVVLLEASLDPAIISAFARNQSESPGIIINLPYGDTRTALFVDAQSLSKEELLQFIDSLEWQP